jgi:hypothetical protein
MLDHITVLEKVLSRRHETDNVKAAIHALLEENAQSKLDTLRYVEEINRLSDLLEKAQS